MAIFHVSVKTVSRSAGRSATGAAAYRSGERIMDERTGQLHDYTRKGGVVSAELVLPEGAPQWATDRAALWNAAEMAENRKNSTVAREFEVALPDELDAEQRRELAVAYAREIVTRHGCAADVAIHEPGKEGDTRNHHAHILVTTRRLGAEGFTDKTRELDDKKTKEVDRWRERWADLTNERLREGGSSARVDHRSLKEQGIDRVPTTHLGPGASGFERRTGEPSRRRLDSQREITERLAAAKAQGDLERQKEQAHRRIIEISEDLNKARAVAKQDRELQTKLTRLENTLDLSEKAGIPITDTERAWLDRDRKELATFRAQHGINEAVTDKPQLGQLTKLDTPEERLRAAREAGEKERQQLGNQVERTRGPEDAQERLRAAREAGEREREEERERPRSRAMRER